MWPFEEKPKRTRQDKLLKKIEDRRKQAKMGSGMLERETQKMENAIYKRRKAEKDILDTL